MPKILLIALLGGSLLASCFAHPPKSEIKEARRLGWGFPPNPPTLPELWRQIVTDRFGVVRHEYKEGLEGYEVEAEPRIGLLQKEEHKKGLPVTYKVAPVYKAAPVVYKVASYKEVENGDGDSSEGKYHPTNWWQIYGLAEKPEYKGSLIEKYDKVVENGDGDSSEGKLITLPAPVRYKGVENGDVDSSEDYFRIGRERKGNSGTHAFQRAAKHENAKFKTYINIGDGESQD